MTPRAAAVSAALADAGYAAGWSLLRRLPEPAAHALLRTAADVAWRRRGRGVVQLEANLARVVGPDLSAEQLRQLSRAALRSYFRYWTEVFRLPVSPPDQICGRVRVIGEHWLRDAVAAGRGAVAALPHMANWDHGGAWLVLSGTPFTTVAERLRPESLFDRFVAFRVSLGMEVLPLDGGRQVFGALAQRLRAGRVVCLLADRDLTASGVRVDFFGEPARMPSGPAALALHTGAALLPVTLWYDDRLLTIRFHPPLEPPPAGPRPQQVAHLTQQLADVFAAGIAAHPADWHMLQRLWLADLAPEAAERAATR